MASIILLYCYGVVDSTVNNVDTGYHKSSFLECFQCHSENRMSVTLVSWQ